MKKLIISQLMLLVMLAFLSSCKKDHDSTPSILVPNKAGVFVYGTNTIATGPTDLTSRMSLAVMDSSHTAGGAKLVDSVFGKFMYIGANSTVSFAAVAENSSGTYVGTVYGADNGGAYDSGSVAGSAMKDKVYHGTLKVNGSPINIAAEGLYYAVVDMNAGTFIIGAVKPEILGDPPYLSYKKGAIMTQKSVSATGATYEATGVNINSGTGYQYTLNNGYAFYAGTSGAGTFAIHSWLGIENYGVAWGSGSNTLTEYYNSNLANPTAGVFTVDLAYDATTDTWAETKTKTGPLLINYSNYKMALEGNAYLYAPGDSGSWKADGTDGYQLKTPTVSGTTYTWSWPSTSLANDKEFLFLQDAKWGGLEILTTNSTMTGNAFTNKDIIPVDGSGNFHVANGFSLVTQTGKLFDVSLIIDAAASTTTVNIVEH